MPRLSARIIVPSIETHLRKVAWQIVQETAPANAKIARAGAAPVRK